MRFPEANQLLSNAAKRTAERELTKKLKSSESLSICFSRLLLLLEVCCQDRRTAAQSSRPTGHTAGTLALSQQHVVHGTEL